jgi:hypothetical protein
MDNETKQAVPADVLTLYHRFVEVLRAGDIDAARQLAPHVTIQTEGWPYSTGPLNPGAFRGDPQEHRLLSWRKEGADRYKLRSGVGYFTVEKQDGEYRITAAGLKPID